MIDPVRHAEQATGHKQVGLSDAWASSGLLAALSVVQGPHTYDYGAIPAEMVAVTLYGVRRHVLRVDGQVRRDAPVRPGRFRIGPAGRHVLVDAVPGQAAGKLLLMYVDRGLLARTAAEADLSGAAGLRDVWWDTEDPFLHMAARRLAEIMERPEAADRLLAGQFALTLALHLLDRYPARPHRGVQAAPSGLHPAALRRVTEYVRAQPAGRPTLAEMAAVAGLGPSHFLRCFKASTGLTPHSFVLRQRVEHAQSLLAGTTLRAGEIALRCGFASPAHLGTAFRAATGVTPLGYRRLARPRGA